MNTAVESIRVDVEELPELETHVAISGSTMRQEVGGAVCVGIAAGVAIYLGSG